MDLLTIQHEDFTMYVDCTKFDDIWNKAKSNVGEKDLLSTYTWSEGVVSVDRNGEPIAKGEKAPAVFFDNAEYPVWVDFKKHVAKAQFGSMLQSDNERFTFRGHTLAGFINYGNDIGKSELNIVYQTGTERKRFTFGYEVLSTKLNYHEHWKKIIEDIEQEYRMLSFDYLRRTFHGFTPDEKGDTPELISCFLVMANRLTCRWLTFTKPSGRSISAHSLCVRKTRGTGCCWSISSMS